MQLDPEYLRQRYASLSDEALLAVDRDELVEMARTIFELELGRQPRFTIGYPARATGHSYAARSA